MQLFNLRSPFEIKSLLPSLDFASNSAGDWVKTIQSVAIIYNNFHLRFTNHSPAKYYYLHHDRAETRAQNCHLGFPWCHSLAQRCWQGCLTPNLVVLFVVLFPLGPVSNIRLSRKNRKDNMESKHHMEEWKCWTKKRWGVGECLCVFPYGQFGPGRSDLPVPETLNLLPADHREKRQERWDFGRIT